jgi:prolyl-tRNA synthetase
LATLWVDPLLAALIEVHRDEQGIAWPTELAPFDVHLLEIKSPEEGEALYRSLRDEGLDVLYDDRKLSTGVKFTDADLIGCPLRVTVGRRSLEQGGAEVSLRGGEEARVVTLEEVPRSVRDLFKKIM